MHKWIHIMSRRITSVSEVSEGVGNNSVWGFLFVFLFIFCLFVCAFLNLKGEDFDVHTGHFFRLHYYNLLSSFSIFLRS